MKRFLKIFCIWSVVGLILATLLDVMISSGLRKTDIRKYSIWNDIYKGGISSDLVIIGNSRAWGGYNTYILDSMLHCNSYNLGFDGHTFNFQLIMYNTYRRYNSKPKIILVNTDFLMTLNNSGSPYEREQFFPFIQDGILMDEVSKVKRITLFDRKIPLLRYFGYRADFETGMMAFFGKTDFPDGGMYKGYRGNEWEWESGILYKDTLVLATVDPKLVEMFDSFTKKTLEEGINIVFVKSPLYVPLRQKFYNIHQSDSVFKVVSKKYNIPVLDYYFSSISMDSTNFYNPSHLNKKGSEAFTISLCHDLDSLGLCKDNCFN